MEFEGIVIRRVPFKGDDVMITVLTDDKMKSFIAKGVLKIFSKNSFSVNLFTKSKFQVFKGMEGDFLRVGEVIQSYPNINNNLEKLALLDFISEITNHLLDKKDSKLVYGYLEKTLDCLNRDKNIWTSVLIYFAHVLIAAGYGMNVDSCQICDSKKEIVGFSIQDGGFVCEHCFNKSVHTKADTRKLKILRYIFKVDLENFEKIDFEKDECKEILFNLIDFLNWTSQIEIKSLTLLKKL